MKRVIWAAGLALILFCAAAFYFYTTTGSGYSSGLLRRLGSSAEERGSDIWAERLYRQALKLNAYDSAVRIRLSKLYEKNSRFSAAQSLLQAGIEAFPSNPSLYLELAALYSREKKLESAVLLLDSAPAGHVRLVLGGKRPSVLPVTPSGYYKEPITFGLEPQEGVAYYYTLDGTVPGFSSPLFADAFPILHDSIIRVVAVNREGIPSKAVYLDYLFDKQSKNVWQQTPICPHCNGRLEP